MANDLRDFPSREVSAIRVRALYYVINSIHMLAHAACLSVLIVYLQDVLPGANASQMALIVIISGLLSEFVFEIVTGQFADRYGRPKAVLLFALCYLTAAFSYMLVKAIPVPMPHWAVLSIIVFGQVVRLLGATFLSGALDAWAVDSLRHYGERDFSRLFATSSVLTNLMWLVGGFVALQLQQYSLVLPWLFMAALMILVSLLAAVGMGEPYAKDKAIESSRRETALAFLVGAFRELRSNTNVLLMTFGFAGGYILWIVVAYLWVPTYNGIRAATGSDASSWLYDVKYAWVAFCAARLLGSMIARWFARGRAFGKWALVGASILNVLPVFVTWYTYARVKVEFNDLVLFFGAITISKIGEETVKPIRSALLNKYIKNDGYRATILSMSTFLGAPLAIFVMFVLWAHGNGAADPGNSEFRWYLKTLASIACISALVSIPMYVMLRDTSSGSSDESSPL